MIIDLRENALFVDDKIEFKKTYSFVFGKNGTGKSTLVKLIADQKVDYDVRIFQGFDKIIDEDNKLNAIVLGEENVEINKKIENKMKDVEKKKLQKQEILSNIEEQVDGKSNLWTEKNSAWLDYNSKNKELEDFCRTSAAKLKNMQNPQVANPNYNTKNFSQEIKYAAYLQDTEIKMYQELLKSDVKTANYVLFPETDLLTLLEEINSILQRKVEEKVRITRFENDKEKTDFAKKGFEIHKKGDVCAFCGSNIKDEVYTELERYFLADDVLDFQTLIGEKIVYLSRLREELASVSIEERNFYSEYEDAADLIKKECESLVKEQDIFYSSLINKLVVKQGYLFSEIDPITCDVPKSFVLLKDQYNILVEQNNTSDLAEKQRFAKDKLRYHHIKKLLDEFQYIEKDIERKHSYDRYCKVNSLVELEREKIEGEAGIDYQLRVIQKEIEVLQEETKSEKKLAENINRKLKNMVSFELVHCEDKKEKGFYIVKCLRTGKKRGIIDLSTGEKNIIAFLYFIEKLKEVPVGEVEKKDKIIVFDDPMNSNDDTMQYLIIEELQSLMKKVKAPDKFILLTHNNHFYLNVKYDKKCNANTFIHMLSAGNVTHINYIEKETDDFKTSYEGLWEELHFLYKNEGATAQMLLNPIRRIVETYTKFNGLNKNKFCENQRGAMKLFNVNSHSIDDLEADLNGKSKHQIIQTLRGCFIDNGVEGHFAHYWKETDES
ncbi:MAG: AAA family ATPase [Agathobacter sp.]|nr:AAA family ATPase [Agathobacter sp.]